MKTSLWTMLPSSRLPWSGPQRLCLYGSYVDMLCVGPSCELCLLTPIPTSPDSKETQQGWLLRLSALCPREFNLSLWFFTCSSSPSSFSQFTSASHALWLHPDATESCPNVYCSFVSSHLYSHLQGCVQTRPLFTEHIFTQCQLPVQHSRS